jgi:hypothetical protein
MLPPLSRNYSTVWNKMIYIYSLFFPGRRVRAHLQNPAMKCDFPIGYFIFLLTLEKCAILQCSVLSIRSKLPFLFHRVLIFLSCFVCVFCLFCVVSIYLLKKQFLEVKKFLYVNKMSQFRSPNKRRKLDLC